MNYILGGGVAGLISAFYLNDYVIIDQNPLGQLNLPFIPGPRIIKSNENSISFIKKLGIEFQEKKVLVGYTENGHKLLDDLTDQFKKDYSLITRNTDKVESSFLSSSEKEITILTDGTDLFYNKVFEKCYELVADRIIKSKVISINTKSKTIQTDNELMDYEHVISTLNLKILTKILNIDNEVINLNCLKKHFVQCSYDNDYDINIASKNYHYIYSTNKQYTRKTYFKDYIVYEMCEENDSSHIESNKVINRICNVPIQIQNSLDIRNLHGIDLIGRYAQWNHSIKANEIINLYEQ